MSSNPPPEKPSEITHCIHCGRSGFKDSEEVILHIKSVHMIVGNG